MGAMGLEERALRHADKFFANERAWRQGGAGVGPQYDKDFHATCVGLLLGHYHEDAVDVGVGPRGSVWASGAMGVENVYHWNDALPSFKAMKSALKARIKHYKALRT